MTGGRLGADPEALRSLAKKYDRATRSTTSVFKGTKRKLDGIGWVGEDADRLRRQELGAVDTAVRAAVDDLGQAADKLRKHADEQERASDGADIPVTNGRVDLRDPREGIDHDKDPSKWKFWEDNKEHQDFDKKNLYGKDLYPRGDDPSPNDVAQGRLGDCWVLASLAAMANSPDGREKLMQMIHDNRDGTYTVTFGDGQEVRVDGDIYMFKGTHDPAYAKGNGNWVQIIEKAYAARKLDAGFESIHGGWSKDSMRALGGYDTTKLQLNPDWMPDPSDDRISGIIKDALRDGRPIVADSKDHAWTITKYEDGNVTVRNPWGSTSEADMKEHFSDLGLTDKYDDINEGGGYLKIKLSNFTAAFKAIEYAK